MHAGTAAAPVACLIAAFYRLGFAFYVGYVAFMAWGPVYAAQRAAPDWERDSVPV